VRLEVAGAAEPGGDALMVRVDVTNRGASEASRLDVEGELTGHYAEGRLAAGVPAGATRTVWLHFPVRPPRAGVHAVALHLRYPVRGATEPASQRAFLLLVLGADVPPAVRLSAAPAVFETSGELAVTLESADGRPHAARLRVLTPRGVNALLAPEVAVPAAGAASARVPLLRTGPSRAERLRLVLLAEATVENGQSTAAGTAEVQLVPHRPLLPRLRIPLAVAGALLLAAAVALEARRRAPRA
jgi:hypothetical protein